ncbi:MAG: hypothetical protein LUE29_10770 [Lachnospiraceae bacterium]|nr:hypothetical protein [Lachnospiraceae bacterium]
MYDLLCWLLFGLVIGAIVALEIWLSRRPSALPGLVMPVVALVVTVPMVVEMLLDMPAGAGADHVSVRSAVVPVLLALFTIVLFLIYAICRRAGRAARQVDKMNIQDL